MPPTTPDPFFAAFGEAVREARKQRGLSQEGLAELSEINRTYLNDVEKGRRNVSLYNIRRLAVALGMTPSELLREAEVTATRGSGPAATSGQ